jgi:hypothetical protein
MGSNCSAALPAMTQWLQKASAVSSTVKIGYLGWLVLMAGTVSLLRSSGRGRCGWEPVTLLILACTPTTLMPVETFFHPEDLMAIGLALGGLACARRCWWGWAGILLGLALTSQQFAVLVLVPLLVVVPSNHRVKLIGSTAGTAAPILVLMSVITSGRFIDALSGYSSTPATGSSMISDLHMKGFPLYVASRIFPIALAAMLAWWAKRHLGSAILQPVPLMSLIATSLVLRLVFEVNLYGYYFMAVAVTLVMLDVLAGRIRIWLVFWLALVAVTYPPLPWVDVRWDHAVPVAISQIVLLAIAIGLGVSPLLALMRRRQKLPLFDPTP